MESRLQRRSAMRALRDVIPSHLPARQQRLSKPLEAAAVAAAAAATPSGTPAGSVSTVKVFIGVMVSRGLGMVVPAVYRGGCSCAWAAQCVVIAGVFLGGDLHPSTAATQPAEPLELCFHCAAGSATPANLARLALKGDTKCWRRKPAAAFSCNKANPCPCPSIDRALLPVPFLSPQTSIGSAGTDVPRYSKFDYAGRREVLRATWMGQLAGAGGSGTGTSGAHGAFHAAPSAVQYDRGLLDAQFVVGRPAAGSREAGLLAQEQGRHADFMVLDVPGGQSGIHMERVPQAEAYCTCWGLDST